jgi:uncharacterized membrane protein
LLLLELHGTIGFMNRTLLVASLLVLSLLGLADAWYLFQAAVSGSALACDLGAGLDGCNIVAKSAYSHLFGLPLALYGVVFYAFLCVLVVFLFFVRTRMLYRAIFWLTAVGVLASIVFLFIQFVLIQALCVYCLASAGISFLQFAVAHRLGKRRAPEVPAVAGPA